jgi:hypothetical protein
MSFTIMKAKSKKIGRLFQDQYGTVFEVSFFCFGILQHSYLNLLISNRGCGSVLINADPDPISNGTYFLRKLFFLDCIGCFNVDLLFGIFF